MLLDIHVCETEFDTNILLFATNTWREHHDIQTLQVKSRKRIRRERRKAKIRKRVLPFTYTVLMLL